MTRLLDYVREHRDDRGLTATLRYSLRPALEHRAWPLFARFGLLGEAWEKDKAAQVLVVKLYALHPLETDKGNFGVTCRSLCGDNEKPWSTEPSPGPMGRRMQRLLASDREDVGPLLVRLVSYAKSKGVPVNYAKLDSDLRHWGDTVRMRWANAFWAPRATEEEDA